MKHEFHASRHTLGELSRLRRETASASPRAFTQVYLKLLCDAPFSTMHNELFELLPSQEEQRRARIAIAAPRGHAKSTLVSLAYVLWSLLYEREKFILIVSATTDQAELLLRHVRDELARNTLLREDFPSLFPHDDEPRNKNASPWQKNKIRLANDGMLMARSVKTSIRGLRNGRHRPGLIIADDLEDPHHVREEDQRVELETWFNSTLLQAGEPTTNVIVIGTILHRDSLLANLVHPDGTPGWTKRIYKAVTTFARFPELWEEWESMLRGVVTDPDMSGEEFAEGYYSINEEAMLHGTEVLWPEREPYKDLMLQRYQNRRSFHAEKQNEPLDPEICVFAEEKIQYWSDEYTSVETLLEGLHEPVIYGACDPSMGKSKRKGDFSAIILIAVDSETKLKYVIAADLDRRSPDETNSRILWYAGTYELRKFGIETNSFQELMVENLERSARYRGIYINLDKIKSTSHKHERIAALEPEIAQGRLLFCRRHTELMNQLLAFPLHSHDDGPDALEMAFTTSNYSPQFRALPISRWN